MKRKKNKKQEPIHNILVIDFEATCGRTISKSNVEIIEVGAFLVSLNNHEIVWEYHKFIKPILHPTLTSFCKRLTNISQENVDQGIEFSELVSEFTSLLNKYPHTAFGAWSTFDWRQFNQDCRLHKLDNPFQCQPIDLQQIFRKVQQEKNARSVKSALEHVGLAFLGTKHSAYDDAKNTARLIPWCFPPKKQEPKNQ